MPALSYEHPLEVIGVPGSPYSRKMLALLRYRRLPYVLRWGRPQDAPAQYPQPKVPLLPTVFFPTDSGPSVAIDSTPIIRQLETLWSPRSVIPSNPGLTFLNALIEDYADEWVTKAMFHYRWARTLDIEHAGPLLVYWNLPTCEPGAAREMATAFSERQVRRRYVVGSNETTAETIESSYIRLLEIFDRLLQSHPFVFGARPCAADFALHGQLTQLVGVDPTPTSLCARLAPRVRAWVDRVEDLSGLTPHDTDWLDFSEATSHLAPLLSEIGRVYMPFLAANAGAALAQHSEWTAEIDGRPWTQPTFPYQVKCLQALRNAFAALGAETQNALRNPLAASGCEQLWADA